MSRPAPRRMRRAASRLLAATSATLFATTVILATLTVPASAATDSEWGSDGLTTSDSAVTVRWDNAGNSAANTVDRSDDAVLPHTGGHTYADLAESDVSWYQQNLADLQVTVSQTEDLVNQNVAIDVTGATGGRRGGAGTTLYVYQCWGAPLHDDDGTYLGVDADATDPDPETCQTAATKGVAERVSSSDMTLIADGDWSTHSSAEIPFLAIDGTVPTSTVTGGTAEDPWTETWTTRVSDNPYFSAQTTNQLTIYPDSSGNAADRRFEVQTTTEAQGLGCGVKADVASTPRCWLVVVPVQSDQSGNSISGLSPTYWANRLQVELGFTDIGGACAGGQQRTLLAGSELLSQAMASWIPQLCDTESTALGYTVLGDAQVRRELDAGTRDTGVLTATSTTESYSSPLALAATVIAYQLDGDGTGPVGQIKLNARLVAKLITESYWCGIDCSGSGSDPAQAERKMPWLSDQPYTLGRDPEFQALNPGLSLLGVGIERGDLVASLTQSDAAAAVWDWILSDPEATAFLHGCPDDDGYVINPFYSTRSYEECADQAEGLDAVTEQRIADTDSPDSYVYSTPSYPSEDAAFPQPGYYARSETYRTDPSTGAQTLDQTELTLGDLHPRQNALGDVGRTVGRAVYPSNSEFCYTAVDETCLPRPGKWKSNSTSQAYGSRFVMGITDSVTAARFGLQTAVLCATSDTTGESCVGADEESLQTAAEDFVASDDVLGASVSNGGTADYDSGAYPLTLPVYGQVATAELTEDDAELYADLFEWFAYEGQNPGYDTGELPPGYAPLTGNLLALADTAIAGLRAYTEPVDDTEDTSTTTTTPSTQATTPSTTNVPTTTQATTAPSTTTNNAAVADPETVAQVGTTGATETGFPQFALVGGLAAALVTGVAAPVVGGPRRRNS